MQNAIAEARISISRSLDRCYPEHRIGGFTSVDGTVAFYTRVNALLDPSSVALDFGCGRGCRAEDPVPFRRDLQRLKGKAARVIGVDIDPVGRENPYLDEFRQLTPDRPWPVDDRSVHLILCDCVMEHLPSPAAFFSEARRVLAKRGYVCIRTPNIMGYVGFISRLLPHSHHRRVLTKAQKNRREEDIFPTLYRCNTAGRLRRALADAGFDAVVYGHESEPAYLDFSKIAYRLGALYQKLAPGMFKNVLFAFGQAAD